LHREELMVGATVTFFPKSEEKASTEMTGEGTQTPSLPQTPFLLENQQDGLLKESSVVNCGT